MSNKNIWITKSREKIAIKDMDDNHILNTIKLLERTTKDNIRMAYASGVFEKGEYSIDDLYDVIDEDDYRKALPSIYFDLKEEAIQRELLIEEE